MAYGDAAYQHSQASAEDLIGMDRLGRAFVRQLARLDSGSIVAVVGGPGSGKTEFMRRVAYVVRENLEYVGLEDEEALYPGYVWYNPWSYAKQGHLVSGLIAHLARAGHDPRSMLDRARDIVGQVNRMAFDGSNMSGGGAALNPNDVDPLEKLHSGVRELVQGAKGGHPGRLVVFIEDMDHLRPAIRWQFLDGLRLLLQSDAKIVVVMAMGRYSGIEAVRTHEGSHLSELQAARRLEEVIDLEVTVPNLDVRRIGTMLRSYIAEGEDIMKEAFGADAVMGLTKAASHRPLGAPRFLRRLASRVTMLSEYAIEAKSTKDLTEAQWAWVIVSERWPHFRRFMIRGGRERWIDLKGAVAQLGKPDSTADVSEEMAKWMEGDLILADYLRFHAEGFDQDSEGIFWLENLLLQAGL